MYEKILKWIILFAISPSSAYLFAQENTHFQYLNTIQLSPQNDVTLHKEPTAAYSGAFLQVYFFKQSKKVDSFFQEFTRFKKSGNQVLFDLEIPNALLTGSDSMAIIPTHHFFIPKAGDSSLRGDRVLDMDGPKDGVRIIKLKLISTPPGATVYMIPKLAWDMDAQLRNKQGAALKPYAVYRGDTPTWYDAQEYVYIALFRIGDKFQDITCSPTHFNPIDSVNVKFP
jgi:hypothetical protein